MNSIPIHAQLSWCKEQMPISQYLLGQLPALRNIRLACSIHLDVKMVPFLEALHHKGMELFVVTCNPNTVRDEVVGILRKLGIRTDAYHGMPQTDYLAAIQRALEFAPAYLCEMGGDLSYAVHQGSAPHKILGSLEATSSGISRLQGFNLRYPVFNWDSVPLKTNIHNRIMVGITACHTFFQRTQLTFHGKKVHVVGYGPVGEGVCRAAVAYGGDVTVTELNQEARARAVKGGFPVVELKDGLMAADVVITATGAAQVINKTHFSFLKQGAFLVNIGHTSSEIDVESLRQFPSEEVLPFIERVKLPAQSVYLFAGGSMANLTAGMGDSLNGFDVTLGILVEGLKFLLTGGAQAMRPGHHDLPGSAWHAVEKLVPSRLKAESR